MPFPLSVSVSHAGWLAMEIEIISPALGSLATTRNAEFSSGNPFRHVATNGGWKDGETSDPASTYSPGEPMSVPASPSPLLLAIKALFCPSADNPRGVPALFHSKEIPGIWYGRPLAR